jgi:hypothetical protein
MSANNWSDKVAFDNFGLALRGSANKWLDSQITLKKIVRDRERWMIIQPFFKEEFATESNDKLILDGLAHMTMCSSENIRDFSRCLNKVNCIILDAYKGFTLMPPELAPDVNGNVSFANMRAHYTARNENLGQFYLLNHFQAALPVDVRRVINLQPMPTFNLDTAVRLATIELCSKEEARSTPQVHAVQPEEEEEGVEAVTQNQAYHPKRFQQQPQQN